MNLRYFQVRAEPVTSDDDHETVMTTTPLITTTAPVPTAASEASKATTTKEDTSTTTAPIPIKDGSTTMVTYSRKPTAAELTTREVTFTTILKSTSTAAPTSTSTAAPTSTSTAAPTSTSKTTLVPTTTSTLKPTTTEAPLTTDSPTATPSTTLTPAIDVSTTKPTTLEPNRGCIGPGGFNDPTNSACFSHDGQDGIHHNENLQGQFQGFHSGYNYSRRPLFYGYCNQGNHVRLVSSDRIHHFGLQNGIYEQHHV
ncbi:hypothetical protein L596_021180 [Steinernema carpocapsae]|uniref:Uncharacterized protein n=1 Tax=Steinernema carpocapsae TaxID=34508 RepID=A0A4U5MVZ2_STECR|nr:hypothetical protein L596_021180 [Steinernema carpocapsae]